MEGKKRNEVFLFQWTDPNLCVRSEVIPKLRFVVTDHNSSYLDSSCCSLMSDMNSTQTALSDLSTLATLSESNSLCIWQM